jgi:hypothetical protein
MTKKLVRVFGLRRSGNHAVLAWLIANISHKSYFHFDQAPINLPLHRSRSFVFDGERHKGGLMKVDVKQRFDTARQSADLISVFHEEQQLNELFDKKKATSLGYDNLLSYNVLVYRDFLNWIASVKRHPNALGGHERFTMRQFAVLAGVLEKWKAHTRRAYGEYPTKKFSLVTVHYDRWLVDRDYRGDRLSELGIHAQDLELPEQSQFGGGSSFQDVSEDGNQGRQLSRWEHYLGDSDFEFLLTMALRDEEIKNLLRTWQPDTLDIIADQFPAAMKPTVSSAHKTQNRI